MTEEGKHRAYKQLIIDRAEKITKRSGFNFEGATIDEMAKTEFRMHEKELH